MIELSLEEKELIRLLQKDLPLSSRPFAELAACMGISETEVIDKINEFKEKGIIRRFGTALRHRELGFLANAMIVWDVPDEITEETGKLMASFPEVTHCYQRPRFSGWPYNLYTMIHSPSTEECRQVAEKIAARTQLDKYELLFSSKELKKTSMKYFLE